MRNKIKGDVYLYTYHAYCGIWESGLLPLVSINTWRSGQRAERSFSCRSRRSWRRKWALCVTGHCLVYLLEPVSLSWTDASSFLCECVCVGVCVGVCVCVCVCVCVIEYLRKPPSSTWNLLSTFWRALTEAASPGWRTVFRHVIPAFDWLIVDAWHQVQISCLKYQLSDSEEVRAEQCADIGRRKSSGLSSEVRAEV